MICRSYFYITYDTYQNIFLKLIKNYEKNNYFWQKDKTRVCAINYTHLIELYYLSPLHIYISKTQICHTTTKIHQFLRK